MRKKRSIFFKTNVLLILFTLIFSNFMPLISNVKALNVGEKVNLVSLGECPHDLGVNNGYVVTEVVGYYRDGEFYPAYCLDRELHGASTDFTYDLDVDHVMQNTEMYNKIWRVMMAGYPYNTPEQMGVSSVEYAYQATKMAVYCVTGQRSPEEFFAYTPQGQEIVDCIWRLYNTSKNSNATYTSPICNMTPEGELYLEKIDGKEYYIQKYNFSGNNEMPSFTVTPSNGKIFNMQNKEQANYDGNGSFKLAIQKDSLKQDTQINLTAKATIKTYPILYGATDIPGTQNYCLSTIPFESTEATETLKITIPSVNIKKLDKNTNLPLEGAEFNIYKDINENGKLDSEDSFVIKSGATNINGIITVTGLTAGKYIVKEITAPEGYLLDSTAIRSFEIQANGNNINLQFEDDEPSGIINIIKEDAETGDITQGNAKFEGAEYKIYAAEDIYNAAKIQKFYSKDQVVATRVIKEDGKTEAVPNLPIGKYYVKETKAPDGYLIDNNTYNVNLFYKDQTSEVITSSVISKDNVKKRQVNIFKSGIKILSGLVPGLEGAEFTIKLNSNVEKALAQGYSYAEIWNGIDEYGNKVSVDSNRVQAAQKIAPTVSKVVTDKTGNAYTDMLPYGKYIVKETVTPQDYETATDFTFSITQDSSEIKDNSKKTLRLVVNNEQLESYIKLVKKDKTTGKIVTASSASFKIKATEDIIDRATKDVIWHKGDYITQKVGNTTYDIFTTNSKNLVVSEKKHSFSSVFDDLGTVITPLKLSVGSYEIVEVDAPDGFLNLDETIKFEIEGIRNYDTDQDGDFVKEIEIFNEQPTGTINLTKEVIYRGTEDADISLIDISDLSGIEFKLTAKENILDKADNSIIYKAGDVIGYYNVSKEGKLEIKNLPMGIYNLEETKTIDGLVLNKEPIEISIIKQDDTTKIYTKDVTVENKMTIVEIYKVDKDSKEQLTGSKLALYDDEENEVASWVSDGTPYIIEGLSAYKEYVLKELEAPNGYYLFDNDYSFNVSNSEGLQKIEVQNELVLKNIIINKKDSDTLDLIRKDFSFGLFEDEECTKLIKEIKSNKDGTIAFNDLEVGTYFIKETIAPEGYNLSEKVLKVEIKADKQKGIIIDDEVQNEENYTAKIDFENEIQKGKIKNIQKVLPKTGF